MKIISILILAFLATFSLAQKNLSLYQMNGLPQSIQANPSFLPKSKLYLNLPIGFATVGITNSGFSFNDAFTKRADDSLQINTQQVVDNLAALNLFNAETSYDLIGVGFKLNDLYVNFTSTFKFQTNFLYPKDLLKFALEGNGKNYIGQRASLDGLGINLNSYVEYAFGVTKEIDKKLTVGGRFKLISGIANFQTKKSKLGIYTDPEDFSITIDGDAEINSSNFGQFLDSTGTKMEASDYISNFAKFKNKGIGIDLGATYILNDKITLSASVVDLGSIRWTTNITSYKANIDYKFEGFYLNDYFDSTSTTKTPGERMSDTISSIFNHNKNTDAYSTALTSKIYLGGSYVLTKQITGNVLVMSQFIKGQLIPAFSLGTTFKLKSWLNASVNYSIFNKTYTNVGVGFSIKGGPVQFYVISDNILAFINPLNARSLQIAGGLSLNISGRDKEKKEDKEKK